MRIARSGAPAQAYAPVLRTGPSGRLGPFGDELQGLQPSRRFVLRTEYCERRTWYAALRACTTAPYRAFKRHLRDSPERCTRSESTITASVANPFVRRPSRRTATDSYVKHQVNFTVVRPVAGAKLMHRSPLQSRQMYARHRGPIVGEGPAVAQSVSAKKYL